MMFDLSVPPRHSVCAPPRRNLPQTAEHLAMIQAYRTTGGLVGCEHAAMLLGRHRDQPISQLARWIVAGQMVSFEWQGERLVPLFQFEPADMSPRCGVAAVLAELVDAFECDLEVAAWFTRPSCWLDGAVPLVMIEIDQPAVFQAARAQRYIARA